MASSRTGFRTTHGKRYDLGNLDEMHADMREKFGQVFRDISDRPMMNKHFQECDVCQGLKEANESTVTEMITKRRRMKFEITPSQMARILGLPAGHEVVIMYATMDPNTIQIVVMGEGLPEVPEDTEAPIKHLRLVTPENQAA